METKEEKQLKLDKRYIRMAAKASVNDWNKGTEHTFQ